MKFSRKIALIILSLVVVTGLVLSVVHGYLINKRLEQVYFESATLLSHALADSLAGQIINNQPTEVLSVLNELVSVHKEFDYAYVIDFNGKVFAHTFVNGFPEKFLHAQIEKTESDNYVMLDGERYRHFSIPIIEGMDASFNLGQNRSLHSALLQDIVGKMFIVVLALGAIGILVAYASAKRIAEPIESISDQLASYSRGEEPKELALESDTQELKRLVSIYNNLVRERRSIKSALSISETRFEKLTSVSPVGVFQTDADGQCLYVNPAWCNITGLRQEEALGDGWAEVLHPDDRERVFSEWISAANNFEKFELEYRFVNKDQQEVWVYGQANAEHDELGNVLGYVGTVTDISEQKQAEARILELNKELEARVIERTSRLEESLELLKKENEERKRAERSLVKAKTDAEQANKLKSDFLGRMSHELRTPLNAILGFSQLLEIEKLNETQTDYVNEINHAGSHLLGLINEVLDLSRIESGRFDLNPEQCRLADLVTDSIAMVHPMAMDKNISIDNRIGADCMVLLNVDPLRFKEVLVNLLSNAVKYNHENGTITINSMVHKENIVRLNVIDNGPGMALEQQALVFEPFNRLGAEYSEIEGTGIGLTISKKLVGLMGGEIGLQSIEGQGSTFWIEFPRYEKKRSMENQLERQASNLGDAKLSIQHRVLYVEDNPANLRLVQHLFERLEHVSLISAPNAELGIELAKSRQPELILLDINLPGMDGYEALSRLRNLEQTRHIPVIAISAAAMPRDIERGLAAGFRHYITKPIQVTDLFDAVQGELQLTSRWPNASA